ncbi:daunorubicin resistance protein DrrA family ABC transporter ATP-binding protein [Paenibacillus sp. CCS19]|uniref:ATP-binding cassette domain-containing protein n=1 Tax=Paenibacillus sp. CCS19 TaxID=3158387 RepID=UPI002568D63A|nr:ATP-binding cassette domain-containing protein [Paenibacillus cellulosilyticus]GMK40912.1 daunorubicin resistance protein DrrA family ABC transporter ATP-binding protein [Paenibacillus cellulosilyticus]
MGKIAIEVRGLHKRYGDKIVLSGIDLAVPAGTVFALLGRNGAGKTTLIHILSTLASADAGEVRIAGRDLSSDANGVRGAISLTGQFAAVDAMLTGRENLHMLCRLSGLSPSASRQRTAELLDAFDLKDAAGKRVGSYSGGMRRRLDLALSLVRPKPVLFLDEPTTGLDAMSRRALWTMIRKLREQGMTIFLTTQYLEEADELADQIAVLADGRLIASGSASELKARFGEAVIEISNDDDVIIRTLPTDGTIQDVNRALQEALRIVPANAKVAIRQPSMEDVFLALTGREEEVAVG